MRALEAKAKTSISRPSLRSAADAPLPDPPLMLCIPRHALGPR